MKHKLLAFMVFVSMLLSLSAFAQEQTESKPFFTDGKCWLYWHHPTIDESYYFTLTVVGDTVVEGKDAKILLRDNLYDGISGLPRTSKEVYLEENGKIFMYSPESEQKFLPLFDFNVRKGDKVNDRLVVEDVFTPDYLGQPTRFIWFGGTSYWIEGIGANNNLIMMYDNEGLFPTGGIGSQLLQCFDNGRIIFDSEDIKIVYQRLAGVNDIQMRPDSDTVYDLYGRRVQSPEKGKIYVKGAKTVVW